MFFSRYHVQPMNLSTFPLGDIHSLFKRIPALRTSIHRYQDFAEEVFCLMTF